MNAAVTSDPAGGAAGTSDPAGGAAGTRRVGSAATAIPQLRDPRLDFFRGIAMIIILFSHTPGNVFTSWIPARWGFSDATEMFVFCSGMASAIAFGGTFARAGWVMGSARVAYRVWQVYWAHIALFFVIAMILAAIDLSGMFEKVYVETLNLQPFFADPGPQLVGLFTLTYVPNYFDILPMYLVILAMMPVAMALARIDLRLVALASIALWILAQRAMLEQFGLGHLHLAFPAEPWSERVWFFNPFGWQLVFFTGFAFMRGWIPAPPLNGWLIGAAVLIVIASMPVSSIGVRELELEWAETWRIENRGWFDKSDFGILRYVQFLALAFLAWAAAGESGRRLRPEGPGRLPATWAAVVRMVSKIGQQSLAVFLFSMVLARLLGFAFDQLGRNLLVVTIGNLAGVALLLACAYTVAWFKSQPWRLKSPGQPHG